MKRLLLSSIFVVSILFCSTFKANAQFLDHKRLAVCDTSSRCQEVPLCSLSAACFNFEFFQPIDLGNGNSVLKFRVTNLSSSPFKRATFELPGQGASTAPAVSPNSTFQNRYNHTVQNKFNDSLIAFDVQLPNTFSTDSVIHQIGYEVYYYVVKTADLNAPYGRKAQVTAEAGDGIIFPNVKGVVNFDFDVCQGACPGIRADFILFPPGQVCRSTPANPTQFDVAVEPQPNSTYQWSVTNATIVSGQGTPHIICTPDSAAGTIRITVVITNKCSFAIATKLIQVVNCACPTVINTDCFKQDCCFSYQLLGSEGGEANQLRPAFEIISLCPKDVTSITFTTPGIAAINPGNENPDFNGNPRTFNITTTDTLLTFANPVPPFGTIAPPDSAERFFYTLPISAVTAPGGNLVTITIRTGTETFIQTFDLLNKDPSCGVAPLPVSLLAFKGQPTTQGINLTWTTATEKNNDRFEVERSLDGSHFEKVGTVMGNGNSNMQLQYSFLDKDSPKGTVYYRLNQIDFDGASTRSQIIRLNTNKLEGGLTVQLVPNPCQDKNCSIQLLNVNSNSPVTVEMHDLTGRLVFSQELPDGQTSFDLPKVDSGAGVYILSAKNGSYVAHQRVILK